ncbi:DUF979 domain-containing protein [Niveispirillum sp. KHB5.9]|uniref:DUF979 domain-containing protein n=1 Tax=Niveispirillum sp. KHB5.9 TaxID=3400269 RepID=UPI003A85935B
MIGLHEIYIVGGLFFAACALFGAFDRGNPRRWLNFLFWGGLATSFLAGDHLGDVGNGVLVLGLVAVGAIGLGRGTPKTTSPEERRERAERRGARLLIPALVIPATVLVGTLLFKHLTIGDVPLVESRHATLVSLTLGVLLALALCYAWLRPGSVAPLQEGRRLLDAVGWAAILPQMLASLGAVFALGGVGQAVGTLIGEWLPLDGPFLAVLAYCVGMALFTIIMGNAYAAFPVMTAAVGLPLVVLKFGGDPAVMGAIGMLSGFCGTLMTPMAANFNIVPAVLLELKDRNGVIKAQIPTALPLLAINIALMYLLAFR